MNQPAVGGDRRRRRREPGSRGGLVEIQGKGAVVVGGASGMGRATATRLAASGARVAVLDQASSQGKEVAEELGGVFVACDVTDCPGTEAALKAAVDALGSLHIAVNT